MPPSRSSHRSSLSASLGWLLARARSCSVIKPRIEAGRRWSRGPEAFIAEVEEDEPEMAAWLRVEPIEFD
jgi:hypothetical protein